MPEITTDLLLESFAEALQTSAFASLEPPPEPLTPPVDAEHFVLQFRGKVNGAFHLAASPALGQVLAANILTADPGAQEAVARARDMLKELCNITTGLMLRRLGEEACAEMEIGITEVRPLADAQEWARLAGEPGAAVASAEGFPLAMLVKECA